MINTARPIRISWLFLALFIFGSCIHPDEKDNPAGKAPFLWENANIYFLLTDRFMNGDPSNDINFNRTTPTAVLRGFQGGDMAGVIQKIEEGYFDSLGITALWMTPWFEQIHGSTDEGTGVTYGYHGYWTGDWTSVDPNFGTREELSALVETAHAHGIRIVMDVIMNHTGPVTGQDPVWPEEWVRTSPTCTYKSYETTVSCTLVENLPDIRTESDKAVELPPALLEKWKNEGRLQTELEELDQFFRRTGYPRAPRYYLIKWLTDYIRRYGIDGYRLDTAKHIDEAVWKELYEEAEAAFREWKNQNPEQVMDDNGFYMFGEVYGYEIHSGRNFSFGDREVDFYSQSIHSLINFGFKSDATKGYEALFSTYSDLLQGSLKGQGTVNYLTSHDDAQPFDKERMKPIEAGTKLLLAPGSCQIYYGDESRRNLIIPGANGDATLRGDMNWEEMEQNSSLNGFTTSAVLAHYRKLGQFRREHPAVGAGRHMMVSKQPYIFSRDLETEDYSDQVLVGLELPSGIKEIPSAHVFEEGTRLWDYYSGTGTVVKKGKISVDSPWDMVLLGRK